MMIKKAFGLLTICWVVAAVGMENNSVKRGFFYNISAQQIENLRGSNETDTKYDCDKDWQNLMQEDTSSREKFLESEDLSDEEVFSLESEDNYEKKKEAFEKAFFGNTFLYKKFRELVDIDRENSKSLFSLRSAFLRWLIQNKRGTYEVAKSLVGLYKSSQDYYMYSLWKCISIFLNLPVERI